MLTQMIDENGQISIIIPSVYYLVEEHQIAYPISLIIAVLIAAFGNFILNKKWTFKEKIWS